MQKTTTPLPRRLACGLVLCLALLPAGIAAAEGVVQGLITPADQQRLDNFRKTRNAALREAQAGDPAQFAELRDLLDKPRLSISDFDLDGDWRCRTIKAGGLAPLVVYGWFDCRVSDDGSGWLLEKTSGSQRTEGLFYDDGDQRMIYLGTLYVAGDPIKPYGSGPEVDQVGYAFRSGPSEWRIEFPSPHYESKFDILEFRR